MFTQPIDAKPMLMRYWEGNFIINHEFRFIYCPIPKNASSSLKALCLLLEKEHDYEKVLQPNRLHSYADHHLTLARYSRAEAQAFLNDPHYFRFCVVRNPWDRLTSAYLSKFLKPLAAPPPFVVHVINEVYQHNGLQPNLQKSITFRQFLGYLVRVKDSALNFHWLPQYHFLCNDPFHFISRFETLAEDFQAIKAALHLPLDLPWRNQTPHHAVSAPTTQWADLYPAELHDCSPVPPYQSFYTPDLVEIVRQRYQQDIELFGYEFAA